MKSSAGPTGRADFAGVGFGFGVEMPPADWKVSPVPVPPPTVPPALSQGPVPESVPGIPAAAVGAMAAMGGGLNLRSNPLMEPGLLLRGDVSEVLSLLARQNGVARASLWGKPARDPDPGVAGSGDAGGVKSGMGNAGGAGGSGGGAVELLAHANQGVPSGALMAAERTVIEGALGTPGGDGPSLVHVSTASGTQTVLVLPFLEVLPAGAGGAAAEVSNAPPAADRDRSRVGAGTSLLALALVVTAAPRLDAWLPLMRAAADALLVQRRAAVLAAGRDALEKALEHAAAAVELLARVADAPDLLEAARLLAEEMQAVLGSETGILCRRNWRGLRTIAITGGAGGGRRGEVQDLAEIVAGTAVRESSRMVWGQCAGWIVGAGGGRLLEAALVREMERVFGTEHGVAEPLVDGAGRVAGAWIFLWSSRTRPLVGADRFLDAVRPPAGAQLALLVDAKPGPAAGAALRWWRRASADKRRALRWAAVVAGAVLLWPARHPVRARSELEPEFSRTVAAPFDSLLRKARVRAGQSVGAGEVLAEMDGRELRWQLAEALAKKARAAKEAEKAVTEGEIASARLAELEVASWEEQVRLLEYRRDNLQVRSPAAGVVVSGDLDRAEGTPLRTGDPLYEVAVLERMRLRIGVPDTDIALIRMGQRVRVRFDSDPGRVWEATVSRVSPRSEILENRNVFVCEAVLENEGFRLRPGMKGRAVVGGVFRPLVWRWVRPAWNALRMVLW